MSAAEEAGTRRGAYVEARRSVVRNSRAMVRTGRPRTVHRSAPGKREIWNDSSWRFDPVRFDGSGVIDAPAAAKGLRLRAFFC